jgi:hypothetical protein
MSDATASREAVGRHGRPTRKGTVVAERGGVTVTAPFAEVTDSLGGVSFPGCLYRPCRSPGAATREVTSSLQDRWLRQIGRHERFDLQVMPGIGSTSEKASDLSDQTAIVRMSVGGLGHEGR